MMTTGLFESYRSDFFLRCDQPNISMLNHFKGDAVVELGPKWIHGIMGNPLYEFAVAQGLVGLNDQKSAEHNIVAVTENGTQVRLVST